MHITSAANSSPAVGPLALEGPVRAAPLPGGLHGLSRAEVVASQRRRLFDAMVEVIGERGYAETSVGQVLARARVSRKTFYELFATKDECLYGIYDEVSGCLRGLVEHAYARGVTPRERLDAVIDAIVRWVEAEPALARVCLLEVPSTGAAGQRRLTATLSWLSSVMTDVLGDLEVPEALPELLVGGAHQMVVHRLVNEPADLAALGTDLSEVWDDLERRAA